MRRPIPVKSFFCSFRDFFHFFPFSQAASVATLPSALVVEQFLLGASWVFSRDWREWFGNVLAAAGISNFRWHDLRHTFASRLVMAGVPLRVVQVLMGHKRIETTLRYSHLGEAQLHEAVERLTAKLTDTTTSTGQTTAA